MTDQPHTNYIPVHVGGVQVGWRHPDTGAYTLAVRCDPPGQPISSLPKPIMATPETRYGS